MEAHSWTSIQLIVGPTNFKVALNIEYQRSVDCRCVSDKFELLIFMQKLGMEKKSCIIEKSWWLRVNMQWSTWLTFPPPLPQDVEGNQLHLFVRPWNKPRLAYTAIPLILWFKQGFWKSAERKGTHGKNVVFQLKYLKEWIELP